MIPPTFIHDLLSRVDIAEVVGRHVQLRKGGANLSGLCPFHAEKSPSFTVSPSKQFYHCFGCGANGDAIRFLTEYSGMTFIDAVKDLAQQVGLTVPEEDSSPAEREQAAAQKQRRATLTDVLAKAGEHYRKQLKGSPRAIDYLKGRGLSGEIAAQFGLGYASDGWRGLASVFAHYDDPLLAESGMVIVQDADSGDEAERKRYDRFRDRIMFPIRSVQGDVIGFGGRVLDRGEPKYLNSPETPVFSKGRELYGLFEARTGLRQRGYALVVEGYMDVVALAQHGFANAVATLGTACTAEHVQKLFRFTESVVFSFDGDAAGRRAAGRALEAALPHASDTRSVKFLFLPTEHDPDSFVRELGAEAFERCVAEAVPLSRQMMEVAADGCDLGSAEGRARFLATARPLWQTLPTGLLKRQMLGELGRKAQLPDQELMGLWQLGSAAAKPEARSADADPGAPPDYHDHHPQSGESQLGAPARRPAKPWKKDWQPSGDWKRRREPVDETLGLPRRQPAAPADHALRLLLLASDWWERLSAEDHQLLHGLPGAHGDLIAWLERYLEHHGAGPWVALEAALAEDGLLDTAQRATGGLQREEEPLFEDLQQLLKTLWITQLEAEARQIAQGNPPPEAMLRFKQLRGQIDALKASVIPSAALI